MDPKDILRIDPLGNKHPLQIKLEEMELATVQLNKGLHVLKDYLDSLSEGYVILEKRLKKLEGTESNEETRDPSRTDS